MKHYRMWTGSVSLGVGKGGISNGMRLGMGGVELRRVGGAMVRKKFKYVNRRFEIGE